MPNEKRGETRGMMLRAKGMAPTETRGSAAVVPVVGAVRALNVAGFALWLAGMSWRPPRRLPGLRRLRVLPVGNGTGDWARAAFLNRLQASERGNVPWPSAGVLW